MKMKMSRPDLVLKNGYRRTKTREDFRPYVIGAAVFILIILFSIKGVY